MEYGKRPRFSDFCQPHATEHEGVIFGAWYVHIAVSGERWSAIQPQQYDRSGKFATDSKHNHDNYNHDKHDCDKYDKFEFIEYDCAGKRNFTVHFSGDQREGAIFG